MKNPPLLLRPRIRKVAKSSQNQGGFDNTTLALRGPEWSNCGPEIAFRARWVYVLDVFALRQKPKFVKIRLTFEKVWILDISVRVTLRLKITKSAKKH